MPLFSIDYIEYECWSNKKFFLFSFKKRIWIVNDVHPPPTPLVDASPQQQTPTSTTSKSNEFYIQIILFSLGVTSMTFSLAFVAIMMTIIFIWLLSIKMIIIDWNETLGWISAFITGVVVHLNIL